MDVRMLFGIQIMVFFICFIILLQEWVRNRKRYEGLGLWMSMMFSSAIGYVLLALRGSISDLFSIILANFLIILALILFLTGIIYFFKLSYKYVYNIFVGVVAVLLIAYYTYIDSNLTYRILLLSFFQIWIFLQALHLFIYKIKISKNRKPYIFINNVIAIIVMNIYRIVMLLLDKSGNQNFLDQSTSEILYFLANMLLLMYLMINLAMLVSKRLLDEAIQSEEKFNKIFYKSPYASFITHADTGEILDVNDEMLQLMGYTREEVIGKSVLDLHFYPDKKKREEILRFITEKGEINGIENEFQRKDGTKVKTLFSANSILLDEGQALISTMKDITEIDNLRKKLAYLATHDALTGISNRRYFHESFEERVIDITTDMSKFALVIFDIDNFKKINDEFGHEVGDSALTFVANKAFEYFKAKGTVSRFGGDEFAIIFDDQKREFRKVLEDFKAEIDSTEEFREKYKISISIGVAICPDDSLDYESLLKMADDALFYVKKNGKDDIAFYSDMKLE